MSTTEPAPHNAEQEGLTCGVEPQFVGAHIEDGTGAEWVRIHRAGGPAPWHRVDFTDEREPWSVWSAIPEPTYLMPRPTPVEDITVDMMPTPEYAMVYRCQSEWNDCSWSTENYAEIDAHEELSGHFVTGRMEKVSERG